MAYVLTSISGNLISAASAGYAPTNSADVSAIASAYQVVSSTSTQLYAGTAFLTGVNDAPVSASRAGNAVNAGMANSAYYDGTGRLISSLPDSAAVSSIASSYAESAASGKLDESASSNFYTTANESGFVDSAYVDSAVSGKQDTLTFAYDADSAISSINGSALAGGGGGATGDYVEKSAMEVAIGSGNDVSATSFAFGVDSFANSVGVAFGRSNYASASSLAVGNGNSASSRSFALGSNSRAMTRSMAFGSNASATEGSLAFGSTCKASMDSYVFGSQPTATDYSFAFGNHSIATNTSVAEGYYVSAHSGAVAFGKYNLHGNGHTGSGDSAAFVIGDGTGATARHDLMLVTKDGEITMYSSTADTAGTGIMSSIRAISAAATGGGVDSATVSAIASSYVESGVSSKLDTTAQVVTSIWSSDYQYGGVWLTGVKGVNGNFLAAHWRDDGEELASYGDISGVIDTVSSNSATWGQGGIDSSTCSSIASSYAESAASSKLDTTAFNSGDFYTTANESGYVGSAYVDSAVSGKMDSSAMTSYALSSDVSGTVDLVSTQSANWGGSALQLSAGPGVKLNMVGNTLVVGADETVLWSGTISTDACSTFTLSEYASHFDRLRFYGSSYANTPVMYECPAPTASTGPISVTYVYYCASTDGSPSQCRQSNYSSTNGLVFNASTHRFVYGNDARYSAGNTTQGAPIYKIVGINRTAGV